MKRRGFLAGILAAGFAPAVVGSGILMPVRRLVVPSLDIGVTDVTVSLSEFGEIYPWKIWAPTTREMLRFVRPMVVMSRFGESRAMADSSPPVIVFRRPRIAP